MKHFTFYLVIIAIAMVISACGAEPVPTISAADVQLTAVVAASTMVAQTQAAMPTATPLPPTETPTQTPLPTDTSLPTLNVTFTSTTAPVSNNSGGDPCATRVLAPTGGRETIIRIVNTTNVAITVSMYLNETASHGDCGYRGFTLSRNNDIVYYDLVQGCYNLWAWSDDTRGRFNSSGYGCINNSDKWTFEVSESTIKFVGP